MFLDKNSCDGFLLKFIIRKKFASVEEVFCYFQTTNTISFIVSLYALAVRMLRMKVHAVLEEERVRNHRQVPGGA